MDKSQPSPLAQPGPWNLVAAAYVDENVPLFERYAESALALAKPRSDARIVDVACGPGTLSLVAARRVARVDAIDFSPDMVKQLELRAAAAGITNVESRVGDGEALPYPERSFDAAFSMFGLMFFPQRDRGFAELRRVLKPGGCAVVSSWQVATRAPVLETLLGAISAVLPGFPPPEQPGPLGDPDEFRRELQTAGFDEIDVHEVMHSTELSSVETLWVSVQRAMAPVAMLRERLDAPMWNQLEGSILSALRQRFGAGKVLLEMPAWLGVGIA
ncbi:MAG: putative SAM-dependent methyltransferase [Myxococcales bacterium]|nr:putative SAM-dependent methyltransferase [Myxococcales bacterium]